MVQTLHTGTGNTAATVIPITAAIPASPATGRQRLEGSLPSGNNSATNTSSALNGTHSQEVTQATTWLASRELERASWA
jgi:hypothetical protein